MHYKGVLLGTVLALLMNWNYRYLQAHVSKCWIIGVLLVKERGNICSRGEAGRSSSGAGWIVGRWNIEDTKHGRILYQTGHTH